MVSLEKELESFDEEAFQFAMAKIRTCVIRGEMQPREVLSYSTGVYDIGLDQIVAGILDRAGYQTLGSLLNVTRKDLAKISRIGPVCEKEILEAVRVAKAKIPK